MKKLHENFESLLESLTSFLTRIDLLIPFVICVSAYHYYKALVNAGESVPTAILIAIIFDVVHYGTVEQYIKAKNHKWAWLIAMIFFTAVGFSLQYSSYSNSTAFDWNPVAMRNALIVPFSVVAIGFINNRQSAEKETENETIDGDQLRESITETIKAELESSVAEIFAELRPKQARMLRVLELTAEGMTTAEIASQLQVSTATISRDQKQLNGAIKQHD